MSLSDTELRVLESAAEAEERAQRGSHTGKGGLLYVANDLGMDRDRVVEHLDALREAGLVEQTDLGPTITERGRRVLDDGPATVEDARSPPDDGGGDGGDDDGGGFLSGLFG